MFADLETLRRRRSSKWATHPPDVLPVFVAETDVELAPPIREALIEAIELGDIGCSPELVEEALRRMVSAVRG